MHMHAQQWFEPVSSASAPTKPELRPAGNRDEYVEASGSERRCLTTWVPFGAPRLSRQVVVEVPGRRYRLKGILSVALEYLEDGFVFARHGDLPVHGYGKTPGEALDGFCSMFDSQYRDLVEAPLTALTPHACDERNRLEAIVEVVEDAEQK